MKMRHFPFFTAICMLAISCKSMNFSDGASRQKIAPALALGQDFVVALKVDGRVWSWGKNNHGQLGDGSYTPKPRPTLVEGIDSVIAIRAGDAHVVALRRDGTVWAWGSNEQGQVGNNSSIDQNRPVQVFTGAAAIGSSRYASYAIMPNGELYGWGVNWGAGLGDGTMNNRNTATKLLLDSVVSVGGEEANTLAIRKDGSIWGWGSLPGQKDLVKSPKKLADSGSQIASGVNVFIRKDGTAWAWDAQGNPYILMSGIASKCSSYWTLSLIGKDGSLYSFDYDWNARKYTNPHKVLDQVVAASSWSPNTAAIRKDGSLWTWGGNGLGQLGTGTMDSSLAPIPWGSSRAVDIAAGNGGFMILSPEGVLSTSSGEQLSFPVVRSMGVGTDMSEQYAVVDDQGVAWAFGAGKGAEPVKLLEGVARILPSYQMTLALKEDGSVWTWGMNWGMLGDGSVEPSDSPKEVIEDVAAASTGGWHSLAVKRDGSLWGWGNNDCGQLGVVPPGVKTVDHQGSDYNGDFSNPIEPFKIMDGVKRAWGGRRYSIVETTDGQFLGYGEGVAFGKSEWFNEKPVELGWREVADLSCGGFHILILKDDGSLWGLGDNSFGQLGRENTHDKIREPIEILGGGVAKIAAGYQCSAVLMKDGSVMVFGEGVAQWIAGLPSNTQPKQAIARFE